MESKEKEFLILEPFKHFTLIGLREYLNNYSHLMLTYEKMPTRAEKKHYTSMDIANYIEKGYLPMYLGGNWLKRFDYPIMGLTIVEVERPLKDFTKHITRDIYQ